MDELDTDDDLLDLTEEAATRTIDEAGGEPELSDYEEEDNRTIVKQIVDESNRTGQAESLVMERRFEELLTASKSEIKYLKSVGEDWAAVMVFRNDLAKMISAARRVFPGEHNAAPGVYASLRDF